MYERHFGLREAPFSLTPDTGFVFASESYRAALNTLLYAATDGAAFVKVVGEVGCGKTLLCRDFLRLLDEVRATEGDAATPPRFCTAYVLNPYLDPRGLLSLLATELGAEVDLAAEAPVLLDALNRRLVAIAAEGRQAIVCLDEVQAMPSPTLEVLRLLTNLETPKRKLLQVVLFGQPELDEHLAQHAVRPLLQRIAFDCRLEPLLPAEVAGYVAGRLRAAGRERGDAFEPAALRRLATVTKGVPRLINIVAHKALMLAFGEGKARVARRHVTAAADDTPATARVTMPIRRPIPGLAVAATVVAAVVLYAWRSESTPSAAPLATPPPVAVVPAASASRDAAPDPAPREAPPPEAPPVSGTDWVRDTPSNHCTIQLLTAQESTALAARLPLLEQQLRMGPIRAIRTRDGERTLVRAFVGDFPDCDLAQRALSRLPAELQPNRPLVRRIERLRREQPAEG